MSPVWTVDKARNQLLQLIEDAMTLGPQTISRDGDALVVVINSHEWDNIINNETGISAAAAEADDHHHQRIKHLRSFICG